LSAQAFAAPATVEFLFDLYRGTYVPAYANLVGYFGEKPEQLLIEIENAFAHLSQFYNPELETGVKEANLRKAYSHLTRATLDCYKLLWWRMNEDLLKFYNETEIRGFILNVPEENFLQEYNKFIENAQLARKKELECIGADSLEAVELYKETIKIGKKLLNSIDASNVTKLNKYSKVLESRKFIISFILGIITGVIGNVIFGVYF